MKPKLLIIILLSTTTLKVTAQQKISLEEYCKIVVDSSTSLQISATQIKSSDYALKSKKAEFLPSLSASGNANYFFNNPLGNTTQVKNYSFNTAIRLEQTIYGGNSARNNSNYARIGLSIAKLDYHTVLNSTILEAQQTYWALVKAINEFQISEQYIEIIKKLYSVIKARFEEGYISRTDLLMVESRLNNAILQQQIATKNKNLALENYNSLISSHLAYYYSTLDTLSISNTKIPKFPALSYALDNRSDYQASLLGIKLAEQKVKVTRSTFNPKIAAGIEGVYGTLTPNTSGTNVGYGYAYIRLSATIFEFNKRRNNVNVQKSDVEKSKLTSIELHDEIESALKTNKINLLQSYTQISLAAENLDIATQNLDLNTFSYTEGKLPILDVLNAQTTWLSSYTAKITAIYQFQIALATYYYNYELF